MNRYNPSLRSDVRQLARDTGSGPARFFWGVTGTGIVLSWLVSLAHRLFTSPQGWAWIVAIVAGVAMTAWVAAWNGKAVPSGEGVPQPVQPDLRQSEYAWDVIRPGEFGGEW